MDISLQPEIRHNPMLWLLAFVPVVFAVEQLKPEAHTALFVLSVLAILPLATLLLATVALLIPSAVAQVESVQQAA